MVSDDDCSVPSPICSDYCGDMPKPEIIGAWVWSVLGVDKNVFECVDYLFFNHGVHTRVPVR